MILLRPPLSRALPALIAAALLSALPLATEPASAEGLERSERRALVQSCREDYRRFCSGVRPGGGAILECLRQHAPDLSQACRTAGAELAAKASTPPPGAARPLSDIAYGPHSRQRMDVYLPPQPVKNAPVIVMVHGGAWAIGSKTSPRVVGAKAEHWLPQGVIFVSVGYRLVPDADPIEQARDVGRAVAAVQAQAASWGGDPRRLVLMGHSAGAHLIALLAADEAIQRETGVAPVLGLVALDSAAYDVAMRMKAFPRDFFKRAFGEDPAYWRAASPTQVMSQRPPPMLLVCSTRRADSCPQADAMVAKSRSFGGEARTLPVDLSHRDINAELGRPGAYTDAVDAFLETLGLP